jgi:hypothetical protein
MSLYKFGENATVGVGTYEGEAARPYVSAAVLAADTIANGYVSVLENVHSKAVLRKFSGVAIQANDDCAFSTPAAGQLTLGEAILAVDALKVNEQVCNENLRATWEGMRMRGQNSAAPADFTTYVAQYVAAKTAETVEHNIWAGNWAKDLGEAAPYTAFTGILKNIVAGSPDRETVSALPLAAATVASTSVGILDALAILTSGAEGAPATIAGDPNTKIFMSRKSAQFYYQALAATYQLPFLNDGMVARYAGYDIVTPAGFPDDALLISKVDNLYFGTDLLTDHINASILNLRDVTGDDVTRVIMQFSGGCQVVDLDGLAVWRQEIPA